MSLTITSDLYVSRETVEDWVVSDGRSYSVHQNAIPLIFHNSRTGVDLPNWRQIIRQGLDATTKLTGTKYRVLRARAGEWSFKVYVDLPKPPYRDMYFHGYGWPGVIQAISFEVPSTSPQFTLQLAQEKLIRKAKAVITPEQGGVFLGELGEALHMIRHPAAQLRKEVELYFGRLKKVERYRRSTNRRKALNDLYLEATFGWSPLIGDIRGGFEALLQHRTAMPHDITRVRAVSKVEENSFTHDANTFNGGNVHIVSDIRRRKLVSTKCTAGIKTTTDGHQANWKDVLGLKPEDFLPTAWELCPWSFLVDYFVNIGDVIDAYSLVQRHWSWGNYTTRVSTTNYLSDQHLISLTGVADELWFSPVSFWASKTTIVRDTLQEAVPSLRFRLPGFSSRKWLNIGALGLQYRSIRRPFF